MTTQARPEDEVLAALAVRCDTVIVDFDETLWLRNSTEAYLSSARPRAVAMTLLALLDALRPWIVLPGSRKRAVYRDWLRVLMITVLLPWTLPRWRRSAGALGAEHQNRPLSDALSRGGSPLLLATYGFGPIVRPLLDAMNIDAELAVSGKLLTGFRVRSTGKLAILERRLGRAGLVAAAVVTDSEDDRELLDASGSPMLVRWADAAYVPAFAGSYFPFQYTRFGKRPGQRYLTQNVLLEDIVMLWFAFGWIMPNPVVGAVALVLLHGSFWSVYEIGYHENDHVATLKEDRPHHPTGADAFRGSMHQGGAWLAAAVLAAPGLVLMSRYEQSAERSFVSGGGFLALAGMWAAYLVVARATYWHYNRVRANARGFPYALLQIFRTLGYGILLRSDLVGALGLMSLVLARWIPYLAYRDLGQHWRSSHRLVMLMAFALLLVMGLVAEPQLALWHAAAVLVWLILRAHRPLRELLLGGAAGSGDHTPAREPDAGPDRSHAA